MNNAEYRENINECNKKNEMKLGCCLNKSRDTT